MTDYTTDFKKQAAKSFIESKYSPYRFCTTFSNRQIDPVLLVEWVKDLAISVQASADYWHNQANNQAVIIDRLDAEKLSLETESRQLTSKKEELYTEIKNRDESILNLNKRNIELSVTIEKADAEKEALNLKVYKLAEDNAKLASDGIKVTNKLADMSEENRQLKNTISCYEDDRMMVLENNELKAENARLANEKYILQQEKEVLKRSLSNRFNEYKKLEEDYKMMHERYKTTYSDLHEEQIQNQSLMSEIEELKSVPGHRDNMQFIAICEKIVQDAEELQAHLEKDNVYNKSI